jgi:hypothetical protein
MSKGVSLAQVPQVIMIIIIIGIFIGAGYITLSAFQTASLVLTTVTNESINFATNYTNYSTAYGPILSITQIANATKTFPSDKYGTNANSLGQAFQIYLNANGTYVVGTYLVTYAYNGATKASVGIGYVLSMMDAIATNLPTVGIMVFVGILISVVFWMVATGKIGGKGKSKAGGA